MNKNEELKKIRKQRCKMFACSLFSLSGIAGGWHVSTLPYGRFLQSGGSFVALGCLLALTYFYIAYRVYGAKFHVLKENIEKSRHYRTTAA